MSLPRFHSYLPDPKDKEADSRLVQEFSVLHREKQDVNHRVLDHIPLTQEIGEGEFIVSSVGGTVKFHTKVGGVVKSSAALS